MTKRPRLRECDGCFGYCCIRDHFSYIHITEGDIPKIANYLSISEADFRRDYLTYEGTPRYNALRLKGTGSCTFFRSGLCGIQKVKPMVCRLTQPETHDGVACQAWNKVRALGVL